MGIFSSSNKNSAQVYFPFGETSNSSFYLEKELSFFLSSFETEKNDILSTEQLKNLASIFISRPDVLKDKEIDILEKIIEDFSNKSNDDSLDTNDSQDKKLSIKNAVLKIDKLNSKYMIISDLRLKEFLKKDNENPTIECYGPPIDFSLIIKSLKDYKKPHRSTIKMAETINSILPIQATFAPNTKFFYPKDVDFYTFNFSDKMTSQEFYNNLGYHNLTTNGQYLFLLSTMYLIFAFPIMNNGSIMAPKMIRLPIKEMNMNSIKLTNKSSITAFSNYVEIYPDSLNLNNKIVIDINKFISQDQQETSNANIEFSEMEFQIGDLTLDKSETTFLRTVTDGVIFVVITRTLGKSRSDAEYTCKIYDVKNPKTLIRQVRLQRNRQQIKGNCSLNRQWDFYQPLLDLFPNADYNEVPIETNGTTLSFIFEVSSDYSIYRTFSLVTGEFLNDQRVNFQLTEKSSTSIFNHIISSTVDSLNNCRWLMISSEDKKICLKKMKWVTGINPSIFHIKILHYPKTDDIVSTLNTILKHFCGSLCFPSFLKCKDNKQFADIISYLDESIESSNSPLLIETLVLLVSSNLDNCTNFNLIFKFVKSKMLDIGLKALLFFPIFSKLLSFDQEKTLESLFYLFDQMYDSSKSNENDFLIFYALKMISNCDEFSEIQLIDETKINNLRYLSLYLVHQQILIRTAQNLLANEVILEGNSLKSKILNCLTLYFNSLKELFIKKLDKCGANGIFNESNLKKFVSTPLYQLFHNFLRLLRPLGQNFLVSQKIIELISSIVEKYILIPEFKNSTISMDLLEICYTYSLIISTLISGGGIVPFEENFDLLFRSNLMLLNDSISLDKLFDGNFNFLDNYNFSLDPLYKLIKPNLNKKCHLSEDILKLDKYIMLVFAKHLNFEPELAAICGVNNFEIDRTNLKVSESLRSSFNKMMSIRSTYKSKPERKPAKFNYIANNCYLLMKLRSDAIRDYNEKIKLISDFILSEYSPQYIIDVFRMQKNRIKLTQIGFSLLNKTIQSDKNNRFLTIIKHVMNKSLKNFDRLNSVLSKEAESGNYSSINSFQNEVTLFINSIYPKEIDINVFNKSIETRIIFFRLFKSIKIFPEILEDFWKKNFDYFISNPTDLSLYSLLVSLIKFYTSGSISTLPVDVFGDCINLLIKPPLSTLKLSLFEHILERANEDFVFPNELFTLFFEDSLFDSFINIKIIMRIRYHLAKLLIGIQMYFNMISDEYIPKYLQFIGEHLYDNNCKNSFLVTEMIILLRKIYSDLLQDQFNLLITNALSNNNNYNEVIALSVCAIFGFQMEEINPYNIIEVCLNEDMRNRYLLIKDQSLDEISDSDNNSYICYPVPFEFSSEPIKFNSLPKEAFIKTYPEFIYGNVNLAANLKRILNTFNGFSPRLPVFPILAQALFNFYSIDDKTFTYADQNLIDFMCSLITPFDDIYKTWNSIKLLNPNNMKIKCLPELSPQFGRLEDMLSVTYLSPPFNNDAKLFTLNLEVFNNGVSKSYSDLLHFGIISDSFEAEQLRMSTIGIPSGINFPECQEICDFSSIKNGEKLSLFSLSFDINPSTKEFFIQEKRIGFPIGRKFRIIIITKKKYQITFNPSFIMKDGSQNLESIFDTESAPDLDKIVQTKSLKDHNEFSHFDYLKFPEDIINEPLNPQCLLDEDYTKYPKITNFSTEIKIEEKVKLLSFAHPMNPVLKIDSSSAASESIIVHHRKGLFSKLGRQWITVILMKIAINNSSLITKHAFDLFETFSIPLESHNQEAFNQKLFPFSLDNPSWKSSGYFSSHFSNGRQRANFYYLVAHDMEKALISITKNPECMDYISQGLIQMASSNNLHQISLPNKYLYSKFIKDSSTILLNKDSIVAFNDYKGIVKNACYIEEDDKQVKFDFPLIYEEMNSSSSTQKLNIIENKDKLVSILEVNLFDSSLKNEWIIDTPIELLVLLKNFALSTKNEKYLTIVKTIILDLYLGQSPFVIPYIDQFQDFVQMKCQASLFYKDENYIRHLKALGGYLNSMEVPDQRYVFLYESEQRLIASKFTISDAAHFPEFFHNKSSLPEPETQYVMIPYQSLDPSDIKEGVQSRILMIKLFFQEHKTIVGNQFWEILPLYHQIYMKYVIATTKDEESKVPENLRPKIEHIDDNIIKITNPTSKEYNVSLSFAKVIPNDIKRNIIFLHSKDSQFEDPVRIDYKKLRIPVKIGRGDTYFSLNIDPMQYKNPWDVANLKIDETNPEDKLVKISPKYKSDFVDTMTEFLLKWKQEDTDKLINLFSIDDLNSPSFEAISKKVLSSNLSLNYSKPVLLLRALLIHHFNFIRKNKQKNVSLLLWNSCSNLVPIIEKGYSLQKAIKSNDRTLKICINRKAATELINEYNNCTDINNKADDKLEIIKNRENSIIFQFAKIVSNTRDPNEFRGLERPFRVSFSDEDGIDVSGLTKVFITEASSSIFEPSTQLFMRANCKEEYFIPDTRVNSKDDKVLNAYFSIGILIGIICRTGYQQYIPFAPFIWKYIAGEQISPDDIIEVDEDLKNLFNMIRNKKQTPDWKAIPWIGNKEITLKTENYQSDSTDDKDEKEKDNIEQYLNEYTNFRVNLLNPMMRKIREGFHMNTELVSHPMLSGKVLSFLAQGIGEITTQKLKDVTEIRPRSDRYSRTMQIFWEVVDEFSYEQKQQLLMFCTGVTRIPNIKHNNTSFAIKILMQNNERGNPDGAFPIASTCSNQLVIPMYSSKEVMREKLLAATMHQTMDFA